MQYLEILTKLDSTFDWIRSLGLSGRLSESRFCDYHTYINRLCTIISTPVSFDGLPDEIKEELKAKHLKYVLSLTESMELIASADSLKTYDEKLARYKLDKILGGPFLPVDEDENSNEARNTLFETNLASKLRSVGLAPSLSMAADVQLQIAGKLILIECKRPLSEKAIRTRIRQARKQIDGWTRQMRSGSRGVIAISVTKVFNPGDKIFPFYEEAAAKEKLSSVLADLAEKSNQTLGSLGKKIIGAMFHVVALSLDQKNHRYSLGEQFNFHHLAAAGNADHAAFQEWGERLSKLEH